MLNNTYKPTCLSLNLQSNFFNDDCQIIKIQDTFTSKQFVRVIIIYFEC